MSTQPEIVNRGKIPSPVPFDVLAVVAEFLIGQHAFGTTANLNVACWGVHQATSPVLYETVFCDSHSYHRWMENPPSSLKYAKYVMLEDEIPLNFISLQTFAKLVLSVYSSRDPNETGACYIRLFRPVSTATTVTVLATPIAHLQTEDHMCLTAVERASFVGRHVRVGIWLTAAKQLERRSWRVSAFHYSGTPGIRDDGALPLPYPNQLESVTTDLYLYHTQIKREYRGPDDSFSMVNTSMELLKIATKHTEPLYVRTAIGKEIRRSKEQHPDHGSCTYHRPWLKWHIKFVLHLSEVDTFLQRLKEEVGRTPIVLANRMMINFAEPVEPGFIKLFTHQLVAIYRMITSDDHVAPLNVENITLAVARCEAKIVSLSDPDSHLALQSRIEDGNITAGRRGQSGTRPTFDCDFGWTLV